MQRGWSAPVNYSGGGRVPGKASPAAGGPAIAPRKDGVVWRDEKPRPDATELENRTLAAIKLGLSELPEAPKVGETTTLAAKRRAPNRHLTERVRLR